MSSSENIDVELLIVAVKKNACIWNYKLEEYSNKTIKNRAWAAVCEDVVSDFQNKSLIEKNAIGIDLQSKWKTLRDGFTRYCRNLKKKSGSAASTTKQYTYYDQLLFLKDVTNDRGQNVSNFDSPLKDVTNDRGQNVSNFDSPSLQCSPPVQSTEDNARKRPRKHQSHSDDILIETLTTRLNDQLQKAEKQTSPPFDEDKAFLLSLLSDFKKIPEDWKLDAKGEIIQIIKNYRATSMQNYRNISMPSTSQSSYNTGYSTAADSQFERNPVRPESLSSQDSCTNTIITDLFSD